MRSLRRTLQHIVLVASLLAPSLAHAHINLLEPPSRYEKYNIKDAPCGDGKDVRSDQVSTFEAGATIRVEWNEYIAHPGHFRIAFDADGTDDFAPPTCTSGCNSDNPEFEGFVNDAVLIDGIPHESKEKYTMNVQLPDVTCDNCTLQVIQVMYDKKPYEVPGNDIYYQCADLKLVEGASEGDTGSGDGDGGSTASDTGSGTDSGYGEMDSDTARTDGSSNGSNASDASESTSNGAAESGCSLVPAEGSSPGEIWIWMLLVVLPGILVSADCHASGRRR